MRLSRFFLPILRENPKEAEIVSHRLMLRAGMLRQEAAGIYAFLPLGFRVLKRIEQIVREEQDRAGCQEVLMPTIQSADLWKKSGRYEVYGKEMLRITDRKDREMLYGPTNEELITDIFAFCAGSVPRASRRCGSTAGTTTASCPCSIRWRRRGSSHRTSPIRRAASCAGCPASTSAWRG